MEMAVPGIKNKQTINEVKVPAVSNNNNTNPAGRLFWRFGFAWSGGDTIMEGVSPEGYSLGSDVAFIVSRRRRVAIDNPRICEAQTVILGSDSWNSPGSGWPAMYRGTRFRGGCD